MKFNKTKKEEWLFLYQIKYNSNQRKLFRDRGILYNDKEVNLSTKFVCTTQKRCQICETKTDRVERIGKSIILLEQLME